MVQVLRKVNVEQNNKRKYFEIENEINNLLIQASHIKGNSNSNKKTNIRVKSNTSKNKFLVLDSRLSTSY
jgi:hypothetical protein